MAFLRVEGMIPILSKSSSDFLLDSRRTVPNTKINGTNTRTAYAAPLDPRLSSKVEIRPVLGLSITSKVKLSVLVSPSSSITVRLT